MNAGNLVIDLKTGNIVIPLEMFNTLLNGTAEQQKEIEQLKAEIRELKSKSRYTGYMNMAQENLENAQKLHAANQEIERLLASKKWIMGY